jgi:hypothetical protein
VFTANTKINARVTFTFFFILAWFPCNLRFRATRWHTSHFGVNSRTL